MIVAAGLVCIPGILTVNQDTTEFVEYINSPAWRFGLVYLIVNFVMVWGCVLGPYGGNLCCDSQF